MQSIDRFLEKNKTNKLKIAIIADSVIDEYFDVKVTRISPEFPTQIMLSNDWHPTKTMPGGGANTALQMSNGFNVKAFLLSFIDKRAFRIFSSQPFNCDYSVALEQKDIHMPLKRRFYDGDYPLPRWDIESPNYGLSDEKLKEAQDGLLARFKLLLSEEKIDIVVLSDYGKGIFSGDLPQQIINLCNENNIKTLVDPKNPPVERWRNCSYFKPNAFEACKMTDLPAGNWHKHAEKLKNYNIKNTIITDGPNQPYFNLEQPLQLARIPNKQSVIGAGDCMCAFLAMALAHQMELRDAVEVGWNASSLYIESKHNKPIMPHEFANWNDPIKSKIVSVEDMKTIMGYCKCQWTWTNGCHDFAIHGGHLKVLEYAKRLGDKVIVGLNTDNSVKKLKGDNRPYLTYKQRAENLAHLQYVDFIVPRLLVAALRECGFAAAAAALTRLARLATCCKAVFE
jgi:D-beta-D-heptose 7-phosphate kinase/D-beta-D-heptose 1-phosphate adenosyltransferase